MIPVLGLFFSASFDPVPLIFRPHHLCFISASSWDLLGLFLIWPSSSETQITWSLPSRPLHRGLVLTNQKDSSNLSLMRKRRGRNKAEIRIFVTFDSISDVLKRFSLGWSMPSKIMSIQEFIIINYNTNIQYLSAAMQINIQLLSKEK